MKGEKRKDQKHPRDPSPSCPKFPSTDPSQAGKELVRCLYMHDFCTTSELLNLKSEIQSPKAGNPDNFGSVAGIQMLCTSGCIIASINS